MTGRLLQGVKATKQIMEKSVCSTRQEMEGLRDASGSGLTERSHLIPPSSDVNEAKRSTRQPSRGNEEEWLYAQAGKQSDVFVRANKRHGRTCPSFQAEKK